MSILITMKSLNKLFIKTLIVALSLLFANTLFAETAASKATNNKIAIVGGTVHTMSSAGVIEEGTVLINDGKIQSVNKKAAPAGYKVIDAKGKIVTPGLMNALTGLTLYENTLSGSPEDNEAEDAPFSAALDISYAINPRSTLVPITRIEGITRAAVTALPSRDIFAGQGSLIHLGDADDLLVKPRAFILAGVDEEAGELAGGSRAAAWALLTNALKEANAFNSKNGWQGGHDKPLLTRLDMQALQPVIKRQIPLLVRVARATDIRRVITLKKSHNLNIILLGAEEGWMVANQLAQAKIPVLLDASQNLPTAFESLAATKTNAARLHKAGVKIALTTILSSSEDHNARLVAQFAGQAVAYGLPWEAGLSALTVNAAEIWGIADQYGSLSKGKDADVVVWDGDPLEVMSAPLNVIIRGQEIALESRQTKLRDRYMNLQQDKPFMFR